MGCSHSARRPVMTVSLDEVVLSVAQVVPATEAEGPGTRFALWFQGCPLRCPGCCNPEMLPFAGGTPMLLADVVMQIRDAKEQHAIEGISLLAQEAHALGLSVMVFSGYLLEELRQSSDPAVHTLLSHTDILVDGPFER